MPVLMTACPAEWSEERRQGVAAMVVATLRGLLLERLVGDPATADAGLAALLSTLALLDPR
ncbi:hypothetical protein [Kutzneria buriramensis]|uniref:TetR family transcriptional regulator n=2 Tax=Kutzneria buriramensis TaxID=1045776 RepID=A0A3E0GXI0_9PSEU|nr:hypothetical protein BCF44_1205 [Kutzneria buriramensis]